jgi:hypothetical protein
MARAQLSDDQLDHLLSRAADTGIRPTTTAAAVEALVSEARARGPQSARRRRNRFVLGGVVAGVVIAGVLTAPTALGDWWLRTPPFQGLPDGWLRTTEYVPIIWQSPDGEEERCRTYFELENADADLVAEFDAAILDHDWTDFGQNLYDSLPGSPPATSVEPEVGNLAVPGLNDFVAHVLAEAESSSAGSAAVGAFATTCRTDI